MLYEKKIFLLRKIPQPVWVVVVDTKQGRVVSAIDSNRKPVYADPIDIMTYLYTEGYSCEHGTWFYLLFQVNELSYQSILTKLWNIPFECGDYELSGNF